MQAFNVRKDQKNTTKTLEIFSSLHILLHRVLHPYLQQYGPERRTYYAKDENKFPYSIDIGQILTLSKNPYRARIISKASGKDLIEISQPQNY